MPDPLTSSEGAALLGTGIAALLTLAVLSYLLGDNPIFRLAEHLFIGVAAGYAAALAWSSVLYPRLLLLVREPGAYWHYGVFTVLGLLLLCRGSRSLTILGSLPLGVLFGTGAALALGGALTGSLVPQLRAAVVPVSPAAYGGGLAGWGLALDALLLALGTIAVLSTFHFSQGTGPLTSLVQRTLHAAGGLGRALIMVTFGAVFAGAIMAFFAVLMSRIEFLYGAMLSLLRFAGLGL